ncbi:actin cytoskeleton organization protein [Moesziomyces antarcticus]|uniref:Actin cytoskeleton organization protein n=2 Tax=Pseudozyma antarctica TaxID=84753 RepID=A0A081CLT8_PSEA2|nr:actin cytoskeleton organization protein [Moesziomyces antarcticus]GAK67634.1 actin cytoskeleton organization protein [Moesziomyces antarcticus]SPO48905.1 uncharacterized protein PSANT_06596 [Moesziomyces antarcticus]
MQEAETESLAESIRRFSLSDEPLSTSTAHSFVDAFAPLSHCAPLAQHSSAQRKDTDAVLTELKQARSTALVTLASRSSSASASSASCKITDENLAQLLTPVIRSKLADTTPRSLLAALNFLAALFSVLPTEAHDILIAEGILHLVLEAPDACNAVRRPAPDSASSHVSAQPLQLRDEQLVSLAVAELVSSAANSTVTRKFLAGQQALLDWLDIACVPRNTSSSAPASDSHPKTDAIAILSGLADVKIYRATASESVQGLSQSLSSKQTSQQDHIRKIQQDRSERQRKDHSLFDAIHSELPSRGPGSASSQNLSSIDQAARAELDRSIQLGCLEALAYLTVQPVFKDRLAADTRLLAILCTTFDLSTPKAADTSKPGEVDSQRFDGAFQLGLATILSNLTAYPKTLTAEEKQIRRLRKFANAQETKQNDSATADNDEDELGTVEQADKRCAAVLDARGIETLCSLALAGRPSPNSTSASLKVNPSKSVRTACSDALLALLTKQDRTVRGKAVQQGALKAVLALAAPVLHDLLPAPNTDAGAGQSSANRIGLFSRGANPSTPSVTSHDLAPLQALAKLLISLNPSILFPSEQGLLSVTPVICSLLLAPAASQLQKFEALLALTNLASLSPQICLSIAAFSLETATRDKVTSDSSTTFCSTSVLAHACEQLLMEDHAMLRRAWIELLVNLLQVQEVFAYFVASSPSGSEQKHGSNEQQSRLTLRLRTLLGLSEVDDWAYLNHINGDGSSGASTSPSSDAGGEPSLATRMASLAILAMVSDSEPVAHSLLSLERLFPVLLTNLVLDRSGQDTRNQWERADLQAHSAGQPRNKADAQAQAELNGINLSLRASYVILNVLPHLKREEGDPSEPNGGLHPDVFRATLRDTITHHVAQCKQPGAQDHVTQARKGLLEVLAECLKAA